ncbi:DUF4382 domain-containing protein [Gallaecimonas mangrovi]|uniref:DUF4382 domain-containing protein n=1 Tax=Gallaecimonas mangrovi TaxID=2291597 RepID=UPI000E203973|nr:DUF4382 domain-containing protein [Gallaecimonas mangrovi]
MKAIKLAVLIFCSLWLGACGGGGDDENQTANLSLDIGDAPVDGADKVVITIDSITLKRDSGDDVVLAVTDANGDPVTLDLLDYQGGDTYLAIDSASIPAGTYSDVRLGIEDEDTSLSYVETGDGIFTLKVPSDELKLGGFTATAGGQLAFTLDFNLRRAMTYNPGPQRYIIKPRGISLVESAILGGISGTVTATLAESCNTSTDSVNYGFVYLYSGHSLTTLADDFDSGASGAPDGATAPVASVAVTLSDDTDASYGYQFGLIPAGDYTLAFSCDGINDEPETYEGLTIPNPAGLSYELALSEGQSLVQDISND